MIKRTVLTAAVLVAASNAVSAQGFSGGELGIDYSVGAGDSALGETIYSGSLEFALTPALSLAGDLSAYRFNNITTDATNVTLHAIYHFDTLTSFGAFYGRDGTEDNTRSLYGGEVAADLYGVELEGYAGAMFGDDSAFLAGGDVTYGVAPDFSVIGAFGYANVEDGPTANRISAGVEYEVASGPKLYGQVGRIGEDHGAGSEASAFISVGARIEFGQDFGTTFGRRGLNEILPQP